jgi:hypothetical protein
MAAFCFSTALGDLAQSMKAGEWKLLITEGGFGTSFLETYGCNEFNHSILQYGNKAQWDLASQQFLFLGSPHGNASKFVIYNAHTNTWREGPLPSGCFNQGHTCGGCNVHSYYLSGIDQAKSRFFFCSGSQIYAYDIANNTWSSFAEGKAHYTGLSWFPEMGGMVYAAGGNGVWIHKGSWSKVGDYSLGNIHNVCLYNPVHKLVLFGGGNGSNTVYKIDSSGKVTQMKNSPQSLRICSSLITLDPVSGKFLILYDDNAFYEYDVTSDTWTSKTPPPYIVAGTLGCGTGLVATPVSTYGVIMFVGFSPAMVIVYKHTDSNMAVEHAPLTQNADIHVSPNPFTVGTKIAVSCQLSAVSNIDLGIFNINGKLVKKLKTNGQKLNAGISWNPVQRPAGIYLLKIRTGTRQLSKRMLLQ